MMMGDFLTNDMIFLATLKWHDAFSKCFDEWILKLSYVSFDHVFVIIAQGKLKCFIKFTLRKVGFGMFSLSTQSWLRELVFWTSSVYRQFPNLSKVVSL